MGGARVRFTASRLTPRSAAAHDTQTGTRITLEASCAVRPMDSTTPRPWGCVHHALNQYMGAESIELGVTSLAFPRRVCPWTHDTYTIHPV